jgi:hypothetical protein
MKTPPHGTLCFFNCSEEAITTEAGLGPLCASCAKQYEESGMSPQEFALANL